jgi:hypothetical protein
MIIKFTELLNIKVLKNIAKIYNIKHISNFSKYELIIFLNTYKMVLPIQRYFRFKNMSENTCPISMEKLKYPFVVIKSSSIFHYYDFDTIVGYFSSTRNFSDPLTRQKIKDKTLIYINNLIKYYYNPKSKKLLWSDSMIKEMEYKGTLDRLHNLMTDIMTTEKLTIDYIYKMVNPQLMIYFQTLLNNNIIRTTQIIKLIINSIDSHICYNKRLIINVITNIVQINNLCIT